MARSCCSQFCPALKVPRRTSGLLISFSTCKCVRVRVRVRMCVCARERERERERVRVRVRVHVRGVCACTCACACACAPSCHNIPDAHQVDTALGLEYQNGKLVYAMTGTLECPPGMPAIATDIDQFRSHNGNVRWGGERTCGGRTVVCAGWVRTSSAFPSPASSAS